MMGSERNKWIGKRTKDEIYRRKTVYTNRWRKTDRLREWGGEGGETVGYEMRGGGKSVLKTLRVIVMSGDICKANRCWEKLYNVVAYKGGTG